jgi:N-acylneuraminate cytidylyltransferase
MYKSKSILALITARGGSVGIPGKNVKDLGGKPLIAWTIDAAQQSSYIDRLIISSDSGDIIEVAKKYGCEVPFVRPDELARNETASMPVILHAIDTIDGEYDYLLLLQPTSPFRTPDQIDEIIEKCIGIDAPIMVSVKESSKHPNAMFEIQDGALNPFFGHKQNLRRQDAPKAYEHNGALYLTQTNYLRDKQSYNTEDALAYVMEGAVNLDIDTPEDFSYAEFLIDKGLI